MKKDVAGISGAARIDQLTFQDLGKMEQHGKRLDLTGQGRAVYNDPPITTTGLDLQTLFDAHVSGAFIPQANSKAMHVLIQFPTALVDGEDAEFMLQHARRFCERVFGDQAIFADRVDRDERGRHNVDVFVAPKYTKVTKHQTKTAVAMSRHLKLLATEFNQTPSPRGTAIALQDALFEYFRDDMGLEGVERGNAKSVPGPDWRSAEQLREAELDERERALAAKEFKVACDKRDLDAMRKQQSTLIQQAASELGSAEQLRLEMLKSKADADENRDATKKSRETTEEDRSDWALLVARAQKDQLAAADDREEATQKLDAANRLLAETRSNAILSQEANDKAKNALDQQLVKLSAALNEAMTDRDLAKSDAESSRKLLEKLQVDHQSVEAERESLAKSRRSLEEEKAIHLGQISLLLRATDDDAGLELRPTETAFRMTTAKMTADEEEVFKKTWAGPLFEMARQLAEALDRMRRIVQRLTKREKEVDERETQIAGQENNFATKTKEHEQKLEDHRAAVSALEEREKNVDALEERATLIFENSAKAVRDAEQNEKAARSALSLHEEWFEVLDVLRAAPSEVSVVGSRIYISQNAIEQFPDKIFDLIDAPAPSWVQKVVSERHFTFTAQQHANEKEQAALSLERELQSFLSEHKMTLSLEQERTLSDAKTKLQSIERLHNGRDGPYR